MMGEAGSSVMVPWESSFSGPTIEGEILLLTL